MMTMIY